MYYRKEIDGLRAVAVVPVIFFHAGFEVFSGGFVGVDVFFVISGYLITSIILEEQSKAKFSLVSFYERRARRILPALFLVMLCCLPLAWLLIDLPNDLQSFGRSLIATSLFSSNILFWLESGYFEGAAELKPLLHTWSLAVEEQYYLFFPLFMMITFRLRRHWVLIVLGVAAIVSLALAQWGSYRVPSANFYLLPMRGWELLIGVFAAFYLQNKAPNHKPLSKHWGDALSIVGLVLIFVSVFVFDKFTPFPSLWALFPTLGTVLIILFSVEDTLVGKLLSFKPIVTIGLISYSLYLWHQPLFAFARLESLDEVGATTYLALIAVSILLAYFSWRYVESIFRNRQGLFSRANIFALSLAFLLVFVGLGLVIESKQGFVNRLNVNQLEVYRFVDYLSEIPPGERDCFLNGSQTYKNFDASCQSKEQGKTALLWGDSHAAALTYGMRRAVKNLTRYSASGCPPLHNVSIPRRRHCVAINEFVVNQIATLQPSAVILHANWLRYSDEMAQSSVAQALSDTIEVVKSVSPASKILIVGSMPQWEPSLPARMIRADLKLDTEHYVRSSHFDKLALLDSQIMEVADSHQTEFFSVLKLHCREEDCLATLKVGQKYELLTWDNSHLTVPGSIKLARQIKDKTFLLGLEINPSK